MWNLYALTRKRFVHLKDVNTKLVLESVTRVSGADAGSQSAHALHHLAKVYLYTLNSDTKLCTILGL